MTPRHSPPRATFQQQVLDQLGREICMGRHRPGAVLPPEAELCERFGFSRIVIREAIKSLVAKGMLEVGRRVGTVVLDQDHWNLFDLDVIAWRAAAPEQDASMLRDVLDLRRIAEPAAARLAAERASDAERRTLRAAYMAMVRAVAGKGDYVSADLAFHAAVFNACGNQYLRHMQGVMTAILRSMFEVISQVPEGPANTLVGHEAVCIAIETGDGEAAERAALALIDGAEIDLETMGATPKVPGERHGAGARRAKAVTRAGASAPSTNSPQPLAPPAKSTKPLIQASPRASRPPAAAKPSSPARATGRRRSPAPSTL